MDEGVRITGKIVLVRRGKDGTKTSVSKNLVTNDGDLFYAERGVDTSVPTNFTNGSGTYDGVLILGNTGSPTTRVKTHNVSILTPIPGSTATIQATYPKVNDTDTDNSGRGADIITYKYVYSTSAFTTNAFTEGAITNPSPATSEAAMTTFILTTDSKSSTQTLTVYINHSLTGS